MSSHQPLTNKKRSTMKQYYICKPDGTQEGPYPETIILASYIQGIFPEGTLIWLEGMDDWIPIHEHFLESTPEENVATATQSKISSMKQLTIIIAVILIVMAHFHYRLNKLLVDDGIEFDKVRTLCDFGADINTKDKHGRTLLLKHAKKVFKNRAETVYIMTEDDWTSIQNFINEGADILAQDNKGNGIWHYYFIDELARYKKEPKGIKPNTVEDHKRLTFEDNKRLNTFLAKIDHRNKFWAMYTELTEKLAPAFLLQNNRGETPLMLIWKSSYLPRETDITNYFLPYDIKAAMANMSDKQGNTHLMLAAKAYRTNAISWLVECGADISAVNKKGQTALDIFIQSFPKNDNAERKQLIQLLRRGY